MADYYEILEIPKTASKEEVKTAFKRLALKFHPDRNPNNPYAEEYFKKVNEAYRTLSDDTQRIIYDFKVSNPINTPQYTPTYSNHSPYNSSNVYTPYENSYDPINYVSKTYRQRIVVFTIIGFIILTSAGIWIGYYLNHKTAEKHYLEALEFRKNGEKRAAIVRLGQTIHYDSHFYQAYLLRAKINSEDLHNYFKAWEDYDWLIQHQPDVSAEVYFLRGQANLKLYEYIPAIQDFDKAIQLEAKKAEYYYYRGLAKLESDDATTKKDFCEDFKKAEKLGYQDTEKALKSKCE